MDCKPSYTHSYRLTILLRTYIYMLLIQLASCPIITKITTAFRSRERKRARRKRVRLCLNSIQNTFKMKDETNFYVYTHIDLYISVFKMCVLFLLILFIKFQNKKSFISVIFLLAELLSVNYTTRY